MIPYGQDYPDTGSWEDRDGTVRDGSEPNEVDRLPFDDGGATDGASADNADTAASKQVNGPGDRQWGPLTLVDTADTPTLPATPGRFPAALWQMSDAVAEAIQTPREMVFMFGLSVISAAVGGRREVEVRQDWTELVVLYTVTVAAPSERKSPVVRRMMRALLAVAAERKQAAVRERKKTEQKIEALRAAAKEEDQEAAATTQTEIESLKETLAKLPEVVKMFADNVTPQKLAVEMATQDGRMAILIPEGGDLFGMVCAPKGQFSSAAAGVNLSIYLKGHTGESHMEGRITREGADLERPALTLGVMVQPAVMAALAGETMLRGTGLLARMLYAQPDSRVGYRNNEPDPIPKNVGEAFDKAITKLANEVFDDHLITLTLTPAAYKLVVQFHGDIEVRLRPAGDLDPVSEWAGKLTGQIVRIAALFTLFDNPSAWEIDERAVREAVDLEPFLVGQAKRVADVTSGRSALRDHPQSVVDVIRRRKLEELTVRVIQRSLNKPWVNAGTVGNALAELEDLGYLRRKSPHIHTGYAAGVYEVNPAVHADSDQDGEGCAR